MVVGSNPAGPIYLTGYMFSRKDKKPSAPVVLQNLGGRAGEDLRVEALGENGLYFCQNHGWLHQPPSLLR